MDLSTIPLYDHHCHALKRPDGPLDVRAFRRFFTESPDPRILDHVQETLFYRRALRDLGELLGCDPTEFAILSYRSQQLFALYIQKLIRAASIEVMLVDTGLKANENFTIEEEQELLPCGVREVLRLETLAERLIAESDSFDDMVDRYRHAIRTARSRGIVALKSIAAYRGGLRVGVQTPKDAEAAFIVLNIETDREGSIRLYGGRRIVRDAGRSLIEFLLLVALEEASLQELPMQVHTGFGDPDLDLREANPLHLRPLLELQIVKKVPIVLLHCYPFVREAGYLANVYGNVYLDLSLTIPFAAHGGAQAILDAMELAPISKILLSTDAFSIPEIFYVGALGCRRSLEAALATLARDQWIAPQEVEPIAWKLLHDNAEGLYGKISHPPL